MSAKQSIRIGVDIGGTFTDIALEVGARLYSTKVLTVYSAPEDGIVNGIKKVVVDAGVALADIDMIIHGTTLATNALIERRGARTAFITTKGFRDVIEMRTENRFELYDLNIVLPEPLIAREHRYVLDERLDATGAVLVAPDVGAMAALARQVVGAGYESIAIGFLHAYRDGRHERAMRDAIRAIAPSLPISISSEVSPQIREFQRFNTVCANAYVMPQMSSYLNRLVERMALAGTKCPIYMIHSGGGIISVASAAEFPVRLLESGPAGGAIYAADIAARYGLARVVSYDMGGTTAKVCLIEDQQPKSANTFEVARTYRFKKGSGMPISVPVIEMVEIGAGGGSIASVDELRQVRVGPHSAGSEPGPACYQRGGTAPTVTDADLVLGRLDGDNFAGGSLQLSKSDASRALEQALCTTLGGTATEAAFGVCEIVDENMANAARMHAVESGFELADFVMIAFGGAAPLHAARLCEKLGIDRLLVPPGAGVGSAIGFLRAPFGFEAVRSFHHRLAQFDANEINEVLDALKEEAVGFVREAVGDAQPQLRCTAFMRYAGQGWEIPVVLPVRQFSDSDRAVFEAEFEASYTRLFGRTITDLDIEIVSCSLKADVPVSAVTAEAMIAASVDAQSTREREIFDARSSKFLPSAIVERTDLLPGMRVRGPAAIVERETTTIVTAAFEAVVQGDGCLLLSRKPTAQELVS